MTWPLPKFQNQRVVEQGWEALFCWFLMPSILRWGGNLEVQSDHKPTTRLTLNWFSDWMLWNEQCHACEPYRHKLYHLYFEEHCSVSFLFTNYYICQWLVKILLASLVAHSFSGKERIRLPRWRPGSDPWVGKIPWRRKWWPTPAFLPAESHGQRSLGAYSHGVSKESEVTWQLKNNSEDPLYH